jgi:hypothetical protein
MKTRTTLTLDQDNVARIERLRKQRDASFRDIINETIRAGLNAMERPSAKREPFRTRVFKSGQPLMPVDNIGEVLAYLDEEDRKIKQSAD